MQIILPLRPLRLQAILQPLGKYIHPSYPHKNKKIKYIEMEFMEMKDHISF